VNRAVVAGLAGVIIGGATAKGIDHLQDRSPRAALKKAQERVQGLEQEKKFTCDLADSRMLLVLRRQPELAEGALLMVPWELCGWKEPGIYVPATEALEDLRQQYRAQYPNQSHIPSRPVDGVGDESAIRERDAAANPEGP
jgi:hypothetical protein